MTMPPRLHQVVAAFWGGVEQFLKRLDLFVCMRKHWPVNLIIGCLLAIMAIGIFLPSRKGITEDVICLLIYCGAFIVVASLFTVCACYRKARQQQQISYSMVLPIGLIAAVFTALTGSAVVYGARIFTTAYWSLTWQQWPVWSGLFLLGFSVSLLSAFGIISYCKRQRRDDVYRS